MSVLRRPALWPETPKGDNIVCGRFSIITDIQQLALQFQFNGSGFDSAPRYNMAPTQPVLTFTNRGGREAQYMR